MKLRYTRAAYDDLASILGYYHDTQSLQAAHRVLARLDEIIARLLIFPAIGTQTKHPLIRRVTAAPYPYYVFYQLAETEIIILGVRHTARDPSSMPGSA